MSNKLFQSNASKIHTEFNDSKKKEKNRSLKTPPKYQLIEIHERNVRMQVKKLTSLRGCKIWTEFSTLTPKKIPERGGF